MTTTNDTTKKQVKAVCDEMQSYWDGGGDIPRDKLCDFLVRLVELGESEMVCKALFHAVPEEFTDALNAVQTLQAR